MSTPKYDALVAKVRDWANRDSAILTDSLVSDFIDYSADLCYRELRIPPLEYTYKYPAITVAGEAVLQLPPDVTEIVMFSVINSASQTLVFDQKMDIRSFTDKYTTKGEGSFTRKGQNLEFYPAAAVGDIYELHYYRRLFDMDSTYVVNQANIDAGNTTGYQSNTIIDYTRMSAEVSAILASSAVVTSQAVRDFLNGTVAGFQRADVNNDSAVNVFDITTLNDLETGQSIPSEWFSTNVITPILADLTGGSQSLLALAHTTFTADQLRELTSVGITAYEGNEVYNWLRDDNERMILWGALHHAFEYLGSEEQSAKYLNKQMQAIDELNREEKRRRVSGASNTVTYEVSELL